MPFASTTRDRVIGILMLPVDDYYVQLVQDALNRVQTYGGEDAVARVEGYLDKYDIQESALSQATSSAGLIKADVLEWAPGGQTGGFKSEMTRLRNQVKNALFPPRYSGATVIRVRPS